MSNRIDVEIKIEIEINIENEIEIGNKIDSDSTQLNSTQLLPILSIYIHFHTIPIQQTQQSNPQSPTPTMQTII